MTHGDWDCSGPQIKPGRFSFSGVGSISDRERKWKSQKCSQFREKGYVETFFFFFSSKSLTDQNMFRNDQFPASDGSDGPVQNKNHHFKEPQGYLSGDLPIPALCSQRCWKGKRATEECFSPWKWCFQKLGQSNECLPTKSGDPYTHLWVMFLELNPDKIRIRR